MSFMKKISRAGLVLVILGVACLWISLGDTIISFKQAKDFEDILDGDVAAGDHVAGQVLFLLDPFASMQTWTENSKTHTTTAKKTSSQYYVLPGGEGYMGLTIGSKNFSVANKLVDQTYDFLTTGDMPTEELTVDARVVVMDEAYPELLAELSDAYALNLPEIEPMTAGNF